MTGSRNDRGRGRLVVLSGPSGVGKTTVCDRLLGRTGFRRIVTCTTRAPRARERDGVDYVFLTRERFEDDIAAGRFLEHAEVYGNLYGTPREPVEEGIARGETILLNIDVQGARQIREAGIPELVTVFLAPPDLETLERRLAKRSSDTPDAVRRRLEVARAELEEQSRYDHVVLNDRVEDAVRSILRILDHSLEPS